MTEIRKIVESGRGEGTSDGAGVRLTRIIGNTARGPVDPFLLLDEFRTDRADDYVAGFPDHPHRGFETVTYMIEGRMRHADSAGHEGVIETGGVQWMTAGRGIIHSEMPEQAEGLLQGFQLWVNLPASEKMAEPRYQEFDAAEIPVWRGDDGVTVRVIAGLAGDCEGPVAAEATAPVYLDIGIPAGGAYETPLSADLSGFVYVFDGVLEAGAAGSETRLSAGTFGLLGEGDSVRLAAPPDQDGRALLIAGKPIGEPVAWYGPFVMNTREELQQAFDDYRAGRFTA